MRVSLDKMSLIMVSFLLAAPFFMSMYPAGLPGYSAMTLLMVLLTIKNNLKERETPIIEIYILYGVFIIMSFIFLYALLFSTAVIRSNTQQVKNIIIAVVLIFLLISNIRKSDEMRVLDLYFKIFLAVGTALFSLFGLVKFSLFTQGIIIESIKKGNDMVYPQGASLLADYNSFSLAANIGFLSTLEWVRTQKKRWFVSLLFLMLIIQFFAILLSNSRRGLILLLLILMVYYLTPLLKRFFSFFMVKFHALAFSQEAFRRTIFKFFLWSGGITILLVVFFTSLSESSGVHIEKIASRAFTVFAFFTGESENLTSQRTMRWDNAFDQFENASLQEKFFGAGNDYLLEFRANSTFDHPHNALISALLYGGVVAFLIYLSFYIAILFLVFYMLFWKDEKYYSLVVLFAIFYSLTSYYSFFYNLIFSIAPFLLLFYWKYGDGIKR